MKLNGTSPNQIRAARALMGWSQAELASKSGVSVTVVARIESAAVDARISTLVALLKCFEAHRIEFISEADGTIGVIRRETT